MNPYMMILFTIVRAIDIPQDKNMVIDCVFIKNIYWFIFIGVFCI